MRMRKSMAKKTKPSFSRVSPKSNVRQSYFDRLADEEIKISRHIRRSVAKLQRPKPPLMYHYTDSQGLLGILKGNKLWATDIRSMNDATEMSYSLDLLDQVRTVTRLGDGFPFLDRLFADVYDTIRMAFRIYCVCFSELPDDLTQWRAYGGSVGGYSIGLDFSKANFLQTIAEASFDDYTLLAKVIYEREAQVRLLESALEQLRDAANRIYRNYLDGQFGGKSKRLEEGLVSDFASHIVIPIVDLLLRFKHPKFASEREWRIICYVIDPDADRPDGELAVPRYYRIRQGMLCPYVHWPFGPPGSLSLNDPSGRTKLPISGVWQGPTRDPQMMASLVQECLKSLGYGISVSYSQVPIRF
jgi:hypothetical protein